MILKILKPRLALNKAFLKVKPNRPEIELFKKNLIILLGKTDEIEREENQKNHIRDFLLDTYYKVTNEINTKDNKDLVIHLGKSNKDNVGVIIEAKRPSNKGDMISEKKTSAMAIWELILYYFDERVKYQNNEVKHLIISNIYEWYIFDANEFDKNIYRNFKIKKIHDTYLNDKKDTPWFYEELSKILPILEFSMTCAYFDIREYEKPLRNASKSDDNVLIALYKLLSPENLLKLPFANDSNSLDKAFYSELLHIIGLTETKDGSKKLIERKKEGERNRNSLIENAIEQLDATDKISWLKNAHQFGADHKEQIFNVALELSITWINRILFLKLLEAQLIKYNKGNAEYAFLNIDKVKNFDDLNSLFFSVLARKPEDRNAEMKRLFPNVPYLNSSLFEPTELEHGCFFIGQLKDGDLPLLSTSVIKDNVGGKRKGSITVIEYIFEFLNAYNFASEGSEEIQEDNKRLINASVLGLIFEKINGYKDGSFFTPGFITMYMCRETIRRAVLQKFNEAKGWDCPDLNALYNKISDFAEASKIVNSLKICDPAVGSGHFLVSALNEIIAIKSELGILLDIDGRKLKDYNIEVANDELVVTDEEGKIFEYNPNLKESQRVQSALFHEKQTIIENCLFGVDINPNSVKICRLRLWIELLKNAYYMPETNDLETLPNIDINIKCGNSLISRYALDADIKAALKKSKWTIDSYRNAIMSYRNAKTKDEKRELEKVIEIIKNDFETEIWHHDWRLGRKKKLEIQISEKTSVPLFEMSKTEKASWDKEIKKLTDELNKIDTALAEIKNNIIYENALEWRFEFPEVLDDDGNFVGFDVVIGNPPYGVSIKGLERKYLVDNLSKVPDFEIYYWFIDKANTILKSAGQFSYIIPNTILFNVFAQSYRLSLFDNWIFEEVLDCTEFNIFSEATVRNILLFLKKGHNSKSLVYRNTNNIKDFHLLITNKKEAIDKEIIEKNNINWGLLFKLDHSVSEIISKIKNGITLNNYFDTSQGYIPYRTSDLIEIYGEKQGEKITKERLWHSSVKLNEEYKQEIFGRNISKYGYTKSNSYVWYGKHLACYVEPKYFNSKRILVREITNPTIIACLLSEDFVNDPQLISIIEKQNKPLSLEILWSILNSKLATFYHFNSSPKATKGAFPKILVYDINNFPLPKVIDNQIKETLTDLVNQILTHKQSDPNANTGDLERQIDRLVYELYGLSEEEIKIVEGA
ncbi:MAG: TaqI-like C-terminal specificity domain-containing protein [bacterium]